LGLNPEGMKYDDRPVARLNGERSVRQILSRPSRVRAPPVERLPRFRLPLDQDIGGFLSGLKPRIA